MENSQIQVEAKILQSGLGVFFYLVQKELKFIK